jgi:hypothetical protein
MPMKCMSPGRAPMRAVHPYTTETPQFKNTVAKEYTSNKMSDEEGSRGVHQR